MPTDEMRPPTQPDQEGSRMQPDGGGEPRMQANGTSPRAVIEPNLSEEAKRSHKLLNATHELTRSISRGLLAGEAPIAVRPPCLPLASHSIT